MDKLLSTDQVASILNLSDGTLRVWRSLGKKELPYIKLGRAVRYREKDILEYIKNNTHSNQDTQTTDETNSR